METKVITYLSESAKSVPMNGGAITHNQISEHTKNGWEVTHVSTTFNAGVFYVTVCLVKR